MARTTIATPGFLDRLGDRVVVCDRTGGDLEVLRLPPELTADPAFETCLKSRAEQLAAFIHRAAPRVRGVSRLPAPDGRLAVVSDAPKGWRLSEVLQAAEHENQLIHTGTVLYILRQVASMMTALQAVSPEVAHGALGPERVVLSPGGRVLVVEYVLGTALAHLPPATADRLWKEFRIAVPPDGHGGRFTPETDVLQLGLVALSLIHNRPLRRDEYPGKLPELLDTATESRLTGARQPIGANLRGWLERALGLSTEAAAWRMNDAQRGLDGLVSKEGGYFSTPVGLEPLLQNVERFFTVPAAAEEEKPAVAQASEPTAPPAPLPVLTVQAAEPAVAAISASALDTPAPSVSALLPVATSKASAAPALTLVPAPTARVEAEQPAEVEVAPPKPSPFTQFILEEAAQPASPEPNHPELASNVPPVAPSLPPRPALRPVPPPAPRPTIDSGVNDVAPVADMLAGERPPSPRRSGWNDEAWLSRATDRTPSGARSAAAVGPAVTGRLSKSAAATATAVALKPREIPVPAPQPVGVPEPVPASAPLPVSKPVAASSPVPRATSSSLFRLSSPDTDAHEAQADDTPSKSGRVKWLAAAAALIVCLGGFAAWRLWPSGSGKAPAATQSEASIPAASPGSSGAAAAEASPSSASPAATPPADNGSSHPAAAAAPVPADAAPVMGSVQILSAVPLQVTEKGQALGTSAAAFGLPAGRHVLDLSNTEVGYQATQVVDVRPNRVLKLAPVLPKGVVNINATPWAEVLVDGQRIGETPLGNVQMTVGSHEVRFRHPQLGEQVRTVVVTTSAPGRLSVDMKQ